jgi:hypothetical protein
MYGQENQNRQPLLSAPQIAQEQQLLARNTATPYENSEIERLYEASA